MGDKGGHGSPPGDAAVPSCQDFKGQCRLPELPRALPALPSPRAKVQIRQGCPVRRVPGDVTRRIGTASVAARYCAAALSQAGW